MAYPKTRDAAATLKFNGRQYYFCHTACLHLFEADPLAYVDDTEAEGTERSKTAEGELRGA